MQIVVFRLLFVPDIYYKFTIEVGHVYFLFLFPCEKWPKQPFLSCAFGQLIGNDHRAVRCSLRFLVNLERTRDPRTRLSRLDYTPLLDPKTKNFLPTRSLRPS